VRPPAAELGFDALDLPQGRIWLEDFLKINEDGAAQLRASSVPLNSGHGPKTALVQEKTAEQSGEPGKDELLAPGASPQCAAFLVVRRAGGGLRWGE
jgi:hypothetical protein